MGAAHVRTELVSSTPADGETLAGPPDAVTLRFNQDIVPRFAQVTLTAPGGGRSPLQDTTTRRVLSVVVPPTAYPIGGPTGRWALAYRVTSADGYPIAGAGSPTAASGESQTGASTTSAAGPASPPPSVVSNVAQERTDYTGLGLALAGFGHRRACRRGLRFAATPPSGTWDH